VDRAGFLKQVAKPCAVSKLREEDVHIQVVADVAIIYARTTTASQTASRARAAIRMCGSSARPAGSASPQRQPRLTLGTAQPRLAAANQGGSMKSMSARIVCRILAVCMALAPFQAGAG
jgi:hypothetical protein